VAFGQSKEGGAVPGLAAACGLSGVLLLLGCSGGNGPGIFKDKEVVFPAGLEPLETSTAPAPEGEGFPEELALVDGESDEYIWAHGRGYLLTTVEEVWDALQIEEVLVNRRAVDEWTFTADVDPEFDASFRVHNVVHDVVTVEFDVDWRMGTEQGGDETHETLGVRFAKTEGTVFITLMEGSIGAWPVEEGVVELELVWHLRAAQEEVSQMTNFMEDLFGEVRATVHGEPFPTYDMESR
jgi:hypothetical protein